MGKRRQLDSCGHSGLQQLYCQEMPKLAAACCGVAFSFAFYIVDKILCRYACAKTTVSIWWKNLDNQTEPKEILGFSQSEFKVFQFW